MKTDVVIAGWGAVSPAGWSAAALADAVLAGTDLVITVDDAEVAAGVLAAHVERA
jgi:hypothetical protein